MIFEIFRTQQFARFLMVGGFAAFVNFSSRILYSVFVEFSIAVIMAYFTGMATAFVLSKLFVFEQSSHSTRKELYYFSIVNLAAAVQVWVVSVGLALYIFPSVGLTLFREEIAHVIGISIPAFTSYLGHKRLTFKRS